MLKIYKASSGSAIDFAAEELKKYLRMMMPEENDICISFNPLGADGFRLGLFSDLGIEGEVERLAQEFLIDFTYNSNAIEGNTLTLNNIQNVFDKTPESDLRL